jgi:hypothetical protein
MPPSEIRPQATKELQQQVAASILLHLNDDSPDGDRPRHIPPMPDFREP